MINFSNRLKQLRTEQGYTQQQLANLLGISKSAISMYESGVREPDLATLQNISAILDVNLDNLVGITPKKQNSIEASPFLNMKKLIARNGNHLTDAERNTLIALLSEHEL